MRVVLIVIVLSTALLVAPGSNAGGWATVGLSSLPDGTARGQPWLVDIEVLQHGRTPVQGFSPVVTIRNRESGEKRVVTATPTTRPGIYRARVVFPSAGTWSYVVDAFGQTHSFAPVRITAGEQTTGGGAGSGTGDELPWAALASALVAGLAAASLTLFVNRRRRPYDQSAAAPRST